MNNVLFSGFIEMPEIAGTLKIVIFFSLRC